MTDKTDSKERDLPGGWSLTDHGDEISLKGPDGERWRYRESIGTGTDGDFIYRFLRASLAAPALPEGITRDDTVHGETYFTAADMATANAQGFRDGVASVAANAGSEPMAQPSDADAILSKVCDLFHIGKLARTESTILDNIRNVIDHAGLLHAVERDLFPQPELPEDDDPYAEVDEGLPSPNSWAAKDEADYVAQFRAALAARGFNHPSPPEGMVGGWMPIETAPGDMGAYLFLCGGVAVEGFIDATGTYCVRQEAGSGWRKMWRKPTHWMSLPPPPTTSAGGGKGE